MKTPYLIILFLTLLYLPATSKAEHRADKSSKSVKQVLQKELDGNRRTYDISHSNARNSPEIKEEVKSVDQQDQALAYLLDEIDELKSKTAVIKATVRNTERPEKKKKIGANTVYPYQDGKIYEVFAGVDRITDIALDSKERLSNSPLSGDTVRWKINVILSGAGTNERQHVILKPLEEGIETNLILTTDKRTYHLQVKSADWYMPSISWNYPEDAFLALDVKRKKEEDMQCPEFSLKDANFDYQIKSRHDYDWRPVAVFDDGLKTYFKMPKKLKTSEAPALFLIDEDDEVQLVNYRLLCGHYIVDRLFERAELRVAKKLIEIRSNRYRPNFWNWLF